MNKNVVKYVSVALLSSVLAVSSVSAAKGVKELNQAKVAENYVRQQLAEVLSDLADNTAGSVLVYFNVTPNKSFELLNVDGENFDLVRDVDNALRYSSIDVSAVLEGKYLVKIHFVDKYASASSFVPAKDVLRNEISQVLSSVTFNDGGSVVISFMVKDGSFIVKKVEGENQVLASEVEKTLTSNSIAIPAELAGNYQLRVLF